MPPALPIGRKAARSKAPHGAKKTRAPLAPRAGRCRLLLLPGPCLELLKHFDEGSVPIRQRHINGRSALAARALRVRTRPQQQERAASLSSRLAEESEPLRRQREGRAAARVGDVRVRGRLEEDLADVEVPAVGSRVQGRVAVVPAHDVRRGPRRQERPAHLPVPGLGAAVEAPDVRLGAALVDGLGAQLPGAEQQPQHLEVSALRGALEDRDRLVGAGPHV
mmetsp:Transcript_29292/g.87115  ORF Transcript_29292/g.87115 Transcript_29292/m.87115 type:complete len:222 (-) Transcript_29292:821-1486(-)